MAEESVGGIGIGLELDISGWNAGLAKAKSGLDALVKASNGATLSVPLSSQGGTPQRGRSQAPPLAVSASFGVNRSSVQQLRVATNQHLRQMAQGGQSVQVPVSLGRVPYSAMRSQIAHGIGEVPIRIRLDPVGIAGIKSVLTAVLTSTAAGSRSSSAISAAADLRVPRRASGGPVAANQPYIVGERRPEVFWPRSAGTIIPRANGGYAEWVQNRHEAMGGKGRLKITPQEMEYLKRGEHVLDQLHRIGASRPQTATHRAFYDIERANIERRAASIGGVSGKQLVDIVAATSSNQPWDKNVDVAEQLIRQIRTGQRGAFANTEQHKIASAILAGQRVTGIKRLPFADAFYDPNAFPIDRWMGRITSLGLRHGLTTDQLHDERSMMHALRGQDWTGKDVPSPSLRRASVYTIEQAAQRWGMSPREAQAEPWGTVRDLSKEAVKFFRYDKKTGLAVPRWKGGVVKVAKDRLPEGYRFAFTKVPGTVGEAYHTDAYNPEYQNPPRTGSLLSFENWRGGRSRPVDDFAANVIDAQGRVVAVAPWGYMQEWKPGSSQSRGYLHPHMTKVLQTEQGKGLATAMYMASEAFSGVSTKPSNVQLAGGAGLWAQPNRPFGKRYGDLPVDTGYHSPYYDARYDLARTKRTNERRIAAGLAPSSTERLEKLVRGMEIEATNREAYEPSITRRTSRPINERLAARRAAEDARRRHDEIAASIAAGKLREEKARQFRGGVMAPTAGLIGNWGDPWTQPTLPDYIPSMFELPVSEIMRAGGRRPRFGHNHPLLTDQQKAWRNENSMYNMPNSLDWYPHGGPTSSAGQGRLWTQYELDHPNSRASVVDRMVAKAKLLGHRATGGAVLGKLKDLFPRAAGIDSLSFLTERDLNLMAEAAESLAGKYPLTAGHLKSLGLDPRRGRPGVLGTTYKSHEALHLATDGPDVTSLVHGKVNGNANLGYLSQILFPKALQTHATGEARFAADRTLRRADRNDPWLVDPTVGGIMTHEFAHAVDNMHGIMPRYNVPTGTRISKYADRNLAENFAEVLTGSELGHFSRTGAMREPVAALLKQISDREKWLAEPGMNRSLSWAEKQALQGKAAGGQSTKGLYIVNEIGTEKFVPKSREGIIPVDVARQLPGGQELAQRLAMRRYSESVAGSGSGGMDIPGPQQLWSAPSDGWIIPHRLADRIPHRRDGGIALRDKNGRLHSPVHGGLITDAQAAAAGYQIQPSEAYYADRSAATQRIASTRFLQESAGAPPLAAAKQSLASARAFSESINPRATALNDPERLQRFEALMELQGQRTAQRGLTGRGNFSGIFMSAFGGRGRTEARAQYAQASREYELLAPKGEDAIAHFTERLDTAAHSQLRAEDTVKKLTETYGENSKRVRTASQAVIEWQDNVDKSTLQLKNAQAVREKADKALQKSQGGTLSQFGAIQFAGISYQIGQQVAGFLAGAASDVMKPLLDVASGFSSTTSRVTADLAKQLPENGGQLGVTFGKVAAGAGLSGGSTSYLQSILGPSVIAKAAANAQGNASDLFRAAAGVNNAPTGLTGGYGGLFGSSILAQQLGGGRGFEEQITGDVNSIGGGLAGMQLGGARNPGSSGGQFGPRTVDQAYLPSTKAYDPRANYQNLGVVTQELQNTTDAATRYAQATGDANKVQLKFFDDGQKGLDEQAQAFKTADAANDTYARKLAAAGIGWFVNGQVATTADQLKKAQEQAAGGMTLPSQQALVQSLAPQIKAQIASTAASTAFAVGGPGSGAGQSGLIGGGFGLQLAANPFAAASSGVAVNFQQKLAPQLKEVAQLQNDLSQQAAQGITDMTKVVNDNMGGQAASQFTGYVQDVAKYGTEITAITSTLANKQAAVGALQYGNSLRIINRSISDARGLVTGQGATSGAGANLGAVQRLQFQLQQQSEQLSIAQSQREINFSVAAAGFQAPGMSGEERAARIAEAKYAASIAQKQLDIQKQQVPLAKTSFDVGATRSLQDLQAQRAINQQEYALSQEQVVDQKKVNALQTAMALSQARAQKILDGAVGNWNSALSLASSAAAQYGYDLNSILQDIRKGIDQALNIQYVPDATGNGPKTKAGTSGGKKLAAGAVFNTTGATSLTVGEAQGEHVAVLRNPRALTLGSPSGGGSAPSVTVNVTGNTVRSDADIDTIVRRVASEVERVLNNRGSMLGLRSLGG